MDTQASDWAWDLGERLNGRIGGRRARFWITRIMAQPEVRLRWSDRQPGEPPPKISASDRKLLIDKYLAGPFGRGWDSHGRSVR